MRVKKGSIIRIGNRDKEKQERNKIYFITKKRRRKGKME